MDHRWNARASHAVGQHTTSISGDVPMLLDQVQAEKKFCMTETVHSHSRDSRLARLGCSVALGFLFTCGRLYLTVPTSQQ